MSYFSLLTANPADLFQQNLTQHTAQEAHFAGRHRAVALVRLAVFVAAGAGIWVLLSSGQTAAALGLGFGAYLVFIGLVRWHDAVGYRREHHRLLAQLNRDELARLAGELAGFDPGRRYLDAQHPYAADPTCSATIRCFSSSTAAPRGWARTGWRAGC